MPRFTFTSKVTVSAYTIVEAGTLKEAEILASGRNVELGGDGAPCELDEAWIIEDGDGEPFDVVFTGTEQ